MTDYFTEQRLVTKFMVSIFHWRITPSTLPHPVVPLSLDLPLASECANIAELAAAAFLNPVHVPWDIAEYVKHLTPKQSGQNADAEDALSRKFPVEHCSEVVERPTTVVDCQGNIVLWHLPFAISVYRKNYVWKRLPVLNKALQASARRVNGDADSKGPWQSRSSLFYPSASHLTPGLLNLSPAWFQTGHEFGQPEVSATLKHPDSQVAEWARTNRELSNLVGGLLGIVHPHLYHDCMQTFRLFSEDPVEYIKNHEAFPSALAAWANPFSGLALICNRETVRHRNNNSRYYWYDILASFGDYDDLALSVPGTGRRFSYKSGTLVALSGRALTHQVPMANGERACFAYFVRDKVLNYAGFSEGSWPRVGTMISGNHIS